MAPSPEAIRRRVAEHPQWYHTLELAPGVVTPGYFDLRSVADRVLPHSVAGLRCLDVGTFDGFWGLELERRGAAEVVSIDILDPRGWDWPAHSAQAIAEIGERKAGGSGFEIVVEALDSGVRRSELSVYALDPELHGRFDLVFMGSVLLHLRDPVRALQRVRDVCEPTGSVRLMDAIDPTLSRLFPRRAVADFDGVGRPWWWLPNLAAYQQMVRSAGLEPQGPPVRLRLPPGPGQPPVAARPRTLMTWRGRRLLDAARRGDPHAFIHARPATS